MNDNQPAELTFPEYGRRSDAIKSKIRAAERAYATATDPNYTAMVEDYADVIWKQLVEVRLELAALKDKWQTQLKQDRVRK